MSEDNRIVLRKMIPELDQNILKKWYPLVVDKVNGGYHTNISYDWKLESEQPKTAVTQGQHMWTAAKAAIHFDNDIYAEAANHGFDFFRRKMWIKKYGGFYQMRDHRGEMTDHLGFCDEKRTYGDAFMIFGLAALFELTGDQKSPRLCKRSFLLVRRTC